MGGREIFALAEDKMRKQRRFLDPYLNMESLADELGVHRNALSRAVNQCGGTTFLRWLTAYRVAEVERLAQLEENREELLERLAMLAGFSNRNSFYRGFKNTRGITPGEWRKTNK